MFCTCDVCADLPEAKRQHVESQRVALGDTTAEICEAIKWSHLGIPGNVATYRIPNPIDDEKSEPKHFGLREPDRYLVQKLSITDKSSEAVMAALKAGDISAVVRMRMPHIWGAVSHSIKRWPKFAHLADDMIQAAAVDLIAAAQRLLVHPHPDPPAYLGKTIKNAVRNYVRGLPVRRTTHATDSPAADVGQDFFSVIIERDEIERCCELADKLAQNTPQGRDTPDGRHLTVYRARAEGHTLHECAEVIGLKTAQAAMLCLDRIEQQYRQRNPGELPPANNRRSRPKHRISKQYHSRTKET